MSRPSRTQLLALGAAAEGWLWLDDLASRSMVRRPEEERYRVPLSTITALSRRRWIRLGDRGGRWRRWELTEAGRQALGGVS